MAGKFNINQLLGGTPAQAEEGFAAKRNATTRPMLKVIPLNISNLIPSGDNFYDTDNIAELKLMIELLGIIEPLSVAPIGNGKYKILAGHRRHRACQALVAEGKTEFEYIPCSIESERDEIKEHIILIATNSTQRILTDYEKSMQVQEMTKFLTHLKKRDKLPGRVRDLVAEALNMSVTNVARMSAINNNLAPELKDEFQEGRLGLSAAYELSGLPEEKQHEAAAELQQKGGLSLNDVKEKKQDITPTDAVPATPTEPRPEPKYYPETPSDFTEGIQDSEDEQDVPENQDFQDMSAEDKAVAAITFLNRKRFALFIPGEDARVLDFIIETLENYAETQG